ncbi:MAG: putative enoyl-CoA hydratase [Actinomycetia bacterium]|nr:putative enoyl-CoA hydratase [Actinomycetes bacterium]
MGEHGPLRTEVDGGVVVVTIDHPPTNLVDGALVMGLAGLLDEVEPDESVKVLVFQSADPDYFLMHGDVELLVSIPAGTYQPVDRPNVAAALFDRLATSRLVSIGLLDGAARGGGCELLSALDFRYASPRSVIGQPEVPMGILPGAGGTARWPRLVGRSTALEILLTGRDVHASEALRLGWLHRMAPSARMADEAMALARRIARMPAGSIAAVKQVVDASLSGMADALTTESDALARLMATGAHHDPMRRFLDAGGQTRDGERLRMATIVDAMLDS